MLLAYHRIVIDSISFLKLLSTSAHKQWRFLVHLVSYLTITTSYLDTSKIGLIFPPNLKLDHIILISEVVHSS